MSKQPVLEMCPVMEKQLRLTQERALVSRPSGQRELQMVETTACIRLIILCDYKQQPMCRKHLLFFSMLLTFDTNPRDLCTSWNLGLVDFIISLNWNSKRKTVHAVPTRSGFRGHTFKIPQQRCVT